MSRASGGADGRERGHTLIELMTVVTILATVVALSCPALAELLRGQQLEAAAVGIARQLRSAQWRAVVTGKRARVASSSEGGIWRFSLQREQGAAWVADGEELRVPPGAVVAIAGPEDKVFNPDGTCSMGSITVRGGEGAMYRCTLAPATGRVRFYRGEQESGRGR